MKTSFCVILLICITISTANLIRKIQKTSTKRSCHEIGNWEQRSWAGERFKDAHSKNYKIYLDIKKLEDVKDGHRCEVFNKNDYYWTEGKINLNGTTKYCCYQ